MLQKAHDKKVINSLVANHKQTQSELLPILHGIQEELGYISKEAISIIADMLNISRAEVHGVVSYYHHFRSQPCGQHVIEVCQAEACQSRGSRALDNYVQQQLACPHDATTEDGKFTLQAVYCLGLCATGPSIAIDGKPYSRVNPQKFKTLVEQLA